MRNTVLAFTPILRWVFLIFDIISWTIFAWVIISWSHFFASHTSFRWRYRGAFNLLTQLNDIFSRMMWPLLRPIRRRLNRYDTAGIDWSPMILLILLWLLRALIEVVLNLLLQ